MTWRFQGKGLSRPAKPQESVFVQSSEPFCGIQFTADTSRAPTRLPACTASASETARRSSCTNIINEGTYASVVEDCMICQRAGNTPKYYTSTDRERATSRRAEIE
eukprot:5190839-Pleurochrysis_carterae.AAC.3